MRSMELRLERWGRGEIFPLKGRNNPVPHTSSLFLKMCWRNWLNYLAGGSTVSEDEYDTPSNKHCVNEVTLTGQNPPLRCC